MTPELTYRDTHPWITFRVDLARAEPEFWMLLGESRSKVDHLNHSLLRPDVAEALQTLYLAKGVHATTAIEGNTLSEEESLALLDGSLELPPSQEYLAQEQQNIVDACNWIKDQLLFGASGEISLDLIREFNRRVLAELDLPESVEPGEFRTHSVVVGGYRAAPARECEYLLERMCEWLNAEEFRPSGEWSAPFAIVRAALAHLYLAWIHPFGDGNGRTARLLEVWILLSSGFAMPAAHLLSSHYNETRTEYYRQLDQASASGGNIFPFLLYAVRGFVDEIRGQLHLVWRQQWDDRWEQYVHECFGGANTKAADRQRRLVLELSKRGGPVRRKDLPMMSPELAVAYHGSERTLARDLNVLRGLGLIERAEGGYQPRRYVLVGFLPLRPALPEQ